MGQYFRVDPELATEVASLLSLASYDATEYFQMSSRRWLRRKENKLKKVFKYM